MRTPLIAILVSSIGGAVCAQPANEGPTGLETCFQSARAADGICSNPANDAVQRLDCLQKARTTLLACLEQVPPKTAAESSPPDKVIGSRAPEMTPGTAAPALPSGAASPQLPTATVSPDEPAAAVSPEKPTAGVSPDLTTGTASPDKTTATVRLEKRPAEAASPEQPAEPVSPDKTTAAVAPEKPIETVSPETATTTVWPDKPAATVSPDVPTGTVLPDRPTVAVAPDVPGRDVVVPPKPRDTNWLVSETTSPVDYSPLITAAIRVPHSVRHAPNTLAIRCRGGRTELLVRTEGTWRASRSGEVQVDYQINEQPLVKLPWTASADGKTAIYKDDALGLLQSLPEGAQLKINVVDGPGQSHEATFQLAGLDAVRGKIAAVCKWAPAADRISSQKR
jgi:hypothetical protein